MSSTKGKGNANEHRTIAYLAKKNFISMRAAASKGMLDCDVLGYHITTGEVKHIQAKTNGSYSKGDIDALRAYRNLITAPNVSIELWNWMDRNQYPLILVIGKTEEEDVKLIEDPKMAALFGGRHEATTRNLSGEEVE